MLQFSGVLTNETTHQLRCLVFTLCRETFKRSLFSKSVGKCEQAMIRNVFLESVGIWIEPLSETWEQQITPEGDKQNYG